MKKVDFYQVVLMIDKSLDSPMTRKEVEKLKEEWDKFQGKDEGY